MKRRAIPSAPRAVPSNITVAPPSGTCVFTSTSPVAPVVPERISATKSSVPNPLTKCPTSIAASVVLVTVNVIGPGKAAPPPMAQLAQPIPHAQSPVPSACIGPAKAVVPAGAPEILVIFAKVMPALSNRKYIFQPAPVFTNWLPLSRETTTLTLLPTCVSVTVPNEDWGPQAAVQWSLVKLKVSALAC